MRPRSSLALVSVAAIVALNACGGDPPVAEPGTTSATTTAPPAVDRPSGTDELAMQVNRTIAIGGDGQVYRPAEDAMLDGPSGFAPRIAPPLPPTGWTVAELAPGELDDLYEQAAELGVLDHTIEPGPDYDWCCDRVGWSLTINTGERTLEHLVPYLDAEDLDDAEQEAVAVLIEDVLALDGDDIGTARSYVPERWRIVKVYDQYLSDVDVPAWPLDEEPTEGECVALPTDPDRDTASGPYSSPAGNVAAQPLLPWETC